MSILPFPRKAKFTFMGLTIHFEDSPELKNVIVTVVTEGEELNCFETSRKQLDQFVIDAKEVSDGRRDHLDLANLEGRVIFTIGRGGPAQ